MRETSASLRFWFVGLSIVNFVLGRLFDSPALAPLFAAVSIVASVLTVAAFLVWIVSLIAVRLIRGRRRW
ncbi:hypothetical protein C5B96_04735 [Subtercola sp. Z020]|nr:hypothetical protein C5B96_04735 [Subtercola sp. Z020]